MQTSIVFVCIAVFTLAQNSWALPFQNRPRVTIEQGIIEGNQTSSGLKTFLGIPYAKPPVGQLRWRAPEDPDQFQGVYKALKSGPEPLQQSLVTKRVIGSEDCLYLNVWSPKAQPGELLPVMFWIHGGAFIFGSSNQKLGLVDLYDGSALAEQGRVIIVSANYRLGPLATMAHPDLIQENSSGSTGNYGHLDQIKALEWVQKNIQQFGGDPSNVTIFGESAGGASVLALLASEKAKGLFHRAISQSGLFFDIPLSEALAQGERISKKYFPEQDSLAPIDELRKIPAEKLIKDFPLLSKWGQPRVNYGPVIDGSFLKDTVLNTIKKEQHNQVPVIIGTNADEMKVLGPLFLKDLPSQLSDELYREIAKDLMGEDKAEAAIKYYNKENYGSNKQALLEMLADGKFHSSSLQVANALSKVSSPKGTFRYFYNRKLGSFPLKYFGAGHAMELPFLFPNKKMLLALSYDPLLPFVTPVEYFSHSDFSQQMIRRWTQFAYSGSPNLPKSENKSYWPDAKTGKMMEFTNDGEQIVTNSRFDQLGRFYQQTRNLWNRLSHPAPVKSGLRCSSIHSN